MKTLRIKNAVFIRPTYAYISISDYYLNKLMDLQGNLKVIVYDGDKIAGQGIINSRQWIKTAKYHESVVKLRPDEPLTFWYNNILFKQPQTTEEHLKELAQAGTF